MPKSFILSLAISLCVGVSFAGEFGVNFDSISQNGILIKDWVQEQKAVQIPTLSRSIQIFQDGEWLDIVPIKVANGKAIYEFAPETEMKCTSRCTGQGTGQWYIKDEYLNDPSAAGHSHTSVATPLLEYKLEGETKWHKFSQTITSPAMQLNKDLVYYVRLPKYATRLSDTITNYGACTGSFSDMIDVKIAGLESLDESDDYGLIGSDANHPENHYGTPAMNKALIALASGWKSSCKKAGVLQYNDMSLPWGGLFDIKGNWEPPHSTHRFGINVDVRKTAIKKANRAKFVELACKKFGVQSEGDGQSEAPHYHLTLVGAKNYEVSLDENPRAINCCATPVPDGCLILQNQGQTVAEEDGTSDCE